MERQSPAVVGIGKLIKLSGVWGEEICLWSTHTGEHLKTLTGHKDVVSSVVFSPDGSYIVSGDWYHGFV